MNRRREVADDESAATESLPWLTIRRTRGWAMPRFRDIWEYRELLYFLVWRDITVRYRQTVLGVAWAVLQPLSVMLIFSVFFGRLARVPSDGSPYPLFVYCALLPWQLFATGLTSSGTSLVANQQLITKVYFPRLIIPFSAVLSGLVDFCISFVFLFALMLYYGTFPTMFVFTVPLLALFAMAAALAVGLWLSALNVQYRDVRHIIPFLTQVWLFVTPIAYPSTLVPQKWRPLYGLNPMAGIVDGFRWALLGTTEISWALVIASLLATLALFTGGLIYFRHMEKSFADVV
jgi:lipopolysaccharide transport system permease protein